MKRKIGALFLVFSMNVSVQAASSEHESAEKEVEIVLYDEEGNMVSMGKENTELISMLMEEITGEMKNPIITDRDPVHTFHAAKKKDIYMHMQKLVLRNVGFIE